MHRLGLHFFSTGKLGFTVLSLRLCRIIKYGLGFTVEIIIILKVHCTMQIIITHRLRPTEITQHCHAEASPSFRRLRRIIIYAAFPYIGKTVLGLRWLGLTFNVVLTMMMMTRVLMSRVDLDDSGVNGVHSDRVELEEIMMTLVLAVVMTMMILVLMHCKNSGVNLTPEFLQCDDDDDDSGGDSNESGVDDAWCWRWQSIMCLMLTMTGF